MDTTQLNRIEEMLATLIKMVGDTNARLNSHENKMSIETDSYIRDFKRRL